MMDKSKNNRIKKLLLFIGSWTILSIAFSKNIDSCQCEQCNFSGAMLSRVEPGVKEKVADCSLACRYQRANFSYANLKGANFSICFAGMDTKLRSANFDGANFTKANVKEGIFKGVSFRKANFYHANLKKITFFVCTLDEANFSYAKLNGAKSFVKTMGGLVSTFYRANFAYADLTDANLAGDFRFANFSHARFKHTRLDASVGNNMGEAASADYWQGVDFSNTSLNQVDFNGKTDFTQAILCHTRLPDGSISLRDCKR